MLFEGGILLFEGLLRIVDGLLRILELPSMAYHSFAGTPMKDRKRVVIVGASFAGLACQRDLCKNFDVTIVDFKRYFEYTPGILRTFVEPKHLKAISGAIPSYWNKFVQGEAVGLNPDRTALKIRSVGGGSREIPFDYLLVGSGSHYAGSIKASRREDTLADRQATWDTEHEKLRRANSVLIIGGGAVGVELAGEILTKFPDKKVTITDMLPELLHTFQPKTRAYATDWLRRRRCNLVLNAVIDGKFPDLKIDSHGCTLRDGRRLEADIVYRCMGFRPATEWLKGSLPEDCFDRRGFLIANDFLQVKGFGNIFAMGDAMTHSSNEMKLGHTAELNAHLVVENLKCLEAKAQLRRYPMAVVGAQTTPVLYCLSLGKYDASLGFNWLVINGSLAAFMKWVLEWSKVAQAREAPVGVLAWKFGDCVSLFMGRTLLKNKVDSSSSLEANKNHTA